jgi:hypothetical protein
MKVQLRDVNASNIDEWKRKITELWTIKMADSEYLKKLVESMPRRLSNRVSRF